MAELTGQRHRRNDEDADYDKGQKAGPDHRRGAVMPGLPVFILVKTAGHGHR